MKRSSTALAILVFGFLFGAPLAASAAAVPSTVETGVQDFTFDSYSADYYLDRDAQNHSTLTTVETFVARFPDFDQNRGIIRAIPNDYDGVPLRTNVQSVVDENGEDVPFEKTDSGGFTELALGTDDYVHGRTTYTITYTQQNVVRAFTDTNDDELYWDTNGTGFAQPFASVSARVHVASALKDFLTGNNACYQGPQGSTDACGMTQETQPDGDVVFSASARNLGPGETVTVAIGFTLGTFAQVPAEQQDPGTDPGHPFQPGLPFQLGQTETPWWVHAGSIVVAALAVLGSAFTIVWRFIVPAASKGSGIIIPQYTVPKDLNLLESADVVGRSWTAVPAQLVSFAVRGRIRILDYPVTASGAQYTLQLLNPTGVDDEELELLTAVFGGTTAGAVREVGVIDDTAARAVARVSGGVRRRMLDRGFKKKRSSLAGLLIALGMFILIFVAVGFVILSGFFQWFSGWGILAIVLAFFAVFVCVGFAFRPAALTAEGAERRDYLLGMRDYLQLAEADRFRMLQSPEGAERVRVEGLDPSRPADKVKLYEKLLPFAVLWGIEREWAKELTLSYGDAAPDWFVSSGGFDAVMFSNALSTLSSTSVARSTPTASSGSSWSGSSGGSFSGGSFGGGFSGGGGGGGGGGGR